MFRLILFVGVPLVELVLLALIESQIGLGWTVAIVVATGIVGARLVAKQGRVIWTSFRLRLAEGRVPDLELAHGAMVLVAGALLLTPGVLTDIVGFLLLAPTVRELIRVRFLRRFRVFVT